MSVMWHHLRLALAVTLLLMCGTVQPSFAVAQEAVEPDAAGALANGWSSFFDSEPFSGSAAVEKLTRSQNLGTRLHALHVKSRSLWLAGDAASQKNAQALWGQLAREGQGDPYATARTEIARGLGFAASGQGPKAIDTIEQVVKQNLRSSVTVEAVIVLALLYAEADRIGDATAKLNEADKILEYPESVGLEGKLQKAFAKGVKHARESIASKGRALFELARGMQREKQYARAIALFTKVSEEYPDTDYAPHSQFEVGECLVSMSRQDEAVKHWKAFVAAAPAGPWRGQALLRLIDIHLAERLDLAEAERNALLAKTGMATALGQNFEAATGGWAEAACGLHFRIGTIAFCKEQHAAAAEAFEQARAAAPDTASADRLCALVEIAKNGGGIIPTDCRGAASGRSPTVRNDADAARVTLALSLGMVHHVAGLEDLAARYFSRVTGSPAVAAAKGGKARPAVRPLAGAVPAQLAFALFGKGAVLEAGKKTKEAKEAFIASLKAFKDGTWHDETLFRLASIIEAEAEGRSEKDGEARGDRVTAVRTVRAEASPYWQEIVDRFPESPRRELAMYRMGVLAYERAETASATAASKSGGGGNTDARKHVEKAWSDAASTLGAFTEAYPESSYAGDAFVRQIDLALERLFELERAGTLGPLAATWAKAAPRMPKALQRAPWARTIAAPSAEQAAATRRDCLMLAGLTAYLAERYDEAVEYVSAAGPEAPPAGFTQDYDIHAIGLHFLLEVIRAKKPVTDALALDAATNSSQRMALQLGGLYLASVRPARADAVFRRIIEKEPKLGVIPIGVEAYALLKLAIALDRQSGRQKEGVEILERLAARTDLYGTVWGGTALFRYALYTFNTTGDATKSLPLYQRFLHEYPTHPSRELASYYAFADVCKLGDRPMALKMADAFRATYPKSMWLQSIDQRLLKLPPQDGPDAAP